MKTISNEMKVGLFTVGSAAIVFYMFFILSPDQFRQDQRVGFFTSIHDAAGIVVNTHVKTNGVVVGRVRSVDLDQFQTRIEFDINPQVLIPVGSTIAVKEKGLLGDVFLEVRRAKDQGQYIEAEGLIPPSDDVQSLSKIMEIVGGIGTDVREVTKNLAKVLGGDEGEKSIREIVEDVKGLFKSTKELIADNRSNLTETIQNLRMFSSSLKEILDDENRRKFDHIVHAFDETMKDVEITARNARVITDRIEKGEGTLGRLVNNDQALVEVEAAIKDVRDILAPATKLQFSVDYHGERRQDLTGQHYFNVILRTRPDRFYLLGFTDLGEATTEEVATAPFAEDESQFSNDSIDSDDHVSRRRIIKKEAIRFNVQFGKRWHDLQMRFGFFETSGGIAADYYLLGDRVKLTGEAFDWNAKSTVRKTAHFKSYLQILFYDHIYLVAGLDDITRVAQKSRMGNVFFGAGMSFEDDDLKSLFGSAALAL